MSQYHLIYLVRFSLFLDLILILPFCNYSCFVFTVLRYMIMVQTGRQKSAGASGGNISVTLIGSNGDTGQQTLQCTVSNPADRMMSGKIDVYMLEAVSVGTLKSLRLVFHGNNRGEHRLENWHHACIYVFMEGGGLEGRLLKGEVGEWTRWTPAVELALSFNTASHPLHINPFGEHKRQGGCVVRDTSEGGLERNVTAPPVDCHPRQQSYWRVNFV